MYAVIRRYNIAPGSADTIVQRVNDQFLPMVAQAPGFVAYYVVDPGDGTVASVSIFEDRTGADASTRMASEWVRQSVGSAIKTAPVIITGQVVAQSTAAAASRP